MDKHSAHLHPERHKFHAWGETKMPKSRLSDTDLDFIITQRDQLPALRDQKEEHLRFELAFWLVIVVIACCGTSGRERGRLGEGHRAREG